MWKHLDILQDFIRIVTFTEPHASTRNRAPAGEETWLEEATRERPARHNRPRGRS